MSLLRIQHKICLLVCIRIVYNGSLTKPHSVRVQTCRVNLRDPHIQRSRRRSPGNRLGLDSWWPACRWASGPRASWWTPCRSYRCPGGFSAGGIMNGRRERVDRYGDRCGENETMGWVEGRRGESIVRYWEPLLLEGLRRWWETMSFY